MRTNQTTQNIDQLPDDPYLAALQVTTQAAQPTTRSRDSEIKALQRASRRASRYQASPVFDVAYQASRDQDWADHEHITELANEMFH
ncbi:hypothetical protein J4N45_10625 [Vibrio sp. SCSIO 43140]|uniref:hypothetical protein n=1 Tax=Vibrio sp. SCSIO 43140 TaxID=2819100 RepID=UPI002075D792|nr:hypothetical protein [Vibrio sp. SCSIO 43140]USD58985.1 hypothetical protein J4N45_10625 [Vibrio sp. SCSIO 43140]